MAKCERCEKHDAQDPHPCPYNVEMNEDEDTLCDCCEDCEYECVQDI
jgi:hypothetical protein